MNRCCYLLDDSLLHDVRHDLEVDGPCDHVGRVPPEMWVSVRQNALDLLDLKSTIKTFFLSFVE